MNILLLSAVWNGFSLPLMSTLLSHGGASDSRAQESRVERFLTLRLDQPVRCVLADRESTLQHWFQCLDQHGLAPSIIKPGLPTGNPGFRYMG